MAVPDPHLEELRIMSYSSHPRACKETYKVPRRHDFIEVLWCMDHLPSLPNRWCPAEVLHIASHPDRDIFGKGVIRYLPADIWDEQIEQVEFLDRHQLRCVANSLDHDREPTKEDDGCKHTNDNPILEWRLRLGEPESSDSNSSDKDWDSEFCNTNKQGTGSDRKRMRLLDREKMDNIELHSLRSGHANMAVEIERLKREIVRLSRCVTLMKDAGAHQSRCMSVDCVLPRLRQKLALKMQTGLRQVTKNSKQRSGRNEETTPSMSSIDGVYCGVIKAKVECTLKQFESVSRHVRASFSPSSVYFHPAFTFTQLPLNSSSEFRILFRSFLHLCEAIGVSSTSDMKEMVRKCGRGTRGDLLRMLGTYAYDEEDMKKPSYFYPATSCGSNSSLSPINTGDSRNQIGGSGESSTAQEAITYTRKTREWDQVDTRYIHSLQKETKFIAALDEETTELQAFSMSWNRAADVMERAWSHSLCEVSEVFGWLQITLPFIQAQGKQSCRELGANINDSVWDGILATEKLNKAEFTLSD